MTHVKRAVVSNVSTLKPKYGPGYSAIDAAIKQLIAAVLPEV